MVKTTEKEENNKLAGTHFEKRFAKIMYDHGWWVHLLQDNQNGQPSDVIMAKDNITVLVDCKKCDNNRFPLDRIESNQEYSMGLWKQTGNIHAVFALEVGGEIRIIKYETMMSAKYTHGLKSLNYNQIMARSLPLIIWVASIWKSQ